MPFGERVTDVMRRPAVLGLVLVCGVAAFFSLRASSQQKPKTTRPPAVAGASEAPVELPRSTRRVVDDDKSATPKARDPQGRALFTARWGGAKEELGRERPPEGNPIGPMSFGVDARGRVHVLDNVNARIQVRAADGSQDNNILVDVKNPEDMAVAADGSSAVLDRHRDKAVTLYDDSGKLRGKLTLEGQGIDDVGSITGVFVDGSDVYVEREHGPLVKIGGLDGTPADPRSEIPGRPSRDGKSFLNAGIIQAPLGRVYVSSINRATNEHRFTRELKLDAHVHMLSLLDSDKSGKIYFAAEVEQSPGANAIVLHCLDPLSGEPVGSATLPVNTLPEESFRDLVVLDAGGVIQAMRSDQGVTYARYDCE